jgi:hypothetical protein
MRSFRFDKFPLDEQFSFRSLCVGEGVSHEAFFVFATIPRSNPAGALHFRRVLVVQEETNHAREYYTGATEEWIEAFRRDLRTGVFPKSL